MNIIDLQEIISDTKKEYFEKIENFCKEDELKKFKTDTIDFKEIYTDEGKLKRNPFKNKINKGDCGIYIFFCNDKVKEIIKDSYPKSKKGENQDEYKMLSKYNEENFEDNVKENLLNCLYVGSSKELKSRLREHFDDNPKGPYAMHIGSWKNWLPLKELKDEQIKIFILKLENQNEYFPDQIQFYEDVLWDYYKPLLGRRGPK